MKKLLKKILPSRVYLELREQVLSIQDAHAKKTRYGFISVDITSNCNLRCPFCLNDFAKNKKNILMTEACFDKVLKLLPLVYANNFFTSCLYEPFLHPRFVDFLEKIPAAMRQRAFFTTNLTLPIPDESFKRLSRLHLSYINISLDSLNPGIYESIRQGAKFDRFKDNLERMVKIFSSENSPTPLRYITVVLNSNFHEIPQLVETCHRHYLSSCNEIRFVYQAGHLSLEWKKENLITNPQWAELEDFCARSGYNTAILPPPPEYFPADNQEYSRKAGNSNHFPVNPLLHEPSFGLNIDAQGVVSLFGKGDTQFNLANIDDPYTFFKRKRESLKNEYLEHVLKKTI